MAIAGLGNGGVPTMKIEALAHELRLLKCGMADLQGRLDVLLIEIGSELQQAQAVSESVDVANEPAGAETLAPEAQTAIEVIEAAEASEAGETEAAVAAEAIAEIVEVAQTETIAAVAAEATAALPEMAPIEPASAETAVVEIAEVPAETIAETPTVVDAIATVDGSEPVAPVEVWAEAVVPAADQLEAPAAELPGQNVVVLAKHQEKPGKRRGVIARTARWAAAIALIATVAAVAAAGTGFAGNGELLIKGVCAIAGEGCSITLGMP